MWNALELHLTKLTTFYQLNAESKPSSTSVKISYPKQKIRLLNDFIKMAKMKLLKEKIAL